MKWGRLKKLTSSLLSGDHILPDGEEDKVVLLEYALEEITDLSEPLQLEVDPDSPVTNLVRIGYNGKKFRRANLPNTDDDEVDIDEGLTYAAARLIASYVSMQKFDLHRAAALDLMQRYMNKVESMRMEDADFGVNGKRTFIQEDLS
jgi:hypothetical protein